MIRHTARALPERLVDDINRHCPCTLPGAAAVDAHLIDLPMSARLRAELYAALAIRPQLFARTPVYVAAVDIEAMHATVEAVEQTLALDGYRQTLAARGGAGECEPLSPGWILAYDFHISAEGPKLIEINTNAGGAFLGAALAAAVPPLPGRCRFCPTDRLSDPGMQFASLLRREWQRSGRSGTPGRIAIVDDRPREQFLYPDMLLARALLQHSGYAVEITAVDRLAIDRGRLIGNGPPIDVVLNRLTDFTLVDARHAVLRRAWQDHRVLLSPAPAHHLRYADKRNLALLCNPGLLKRWGLEARQRRALATVPITREVSAGEEQALWQQRREWYFKPFAGFGSKAVYDGAKLTRGTWSAICAGGYVAQQRVAPARRLLSRHPRDGELHDSSAAASALLRYDIRLFVHDGLPFLMTARTYQGQTTNFRTPGGGLAPVVICRPASRLGRASRARRGSNDRRRLVRSASSPEAH